MSATALRQCRQALAPGGACVSVDDGTPKLRREDLVLLAELATKGEIRPVIDRTYALDDIVDARARYLGRRDSRDARAPGSEGITCATSASTSARRR